MRKAAEADAGLGGGDGGGDGGGLGGGLGGGGDGGDGGGSGGGLGGGDGSCAFASKKNPFPPLKEDSDDLLSLVLLL